MTADGHVIQFGAITAPDGCYLLAAGEALHEGDSTLIPVTQTGYIWKREYMEGESVELPKQYAYARKLPEKGGV
jgi:hypothetical protein